MVRASVGNISYWNEWVAFSQETIEKKITAAKHPAVNEVYEAQFLFDLSRDYLRLAFREYSAGRRLSELEERISGVVEFWERSNSVAQKICSEHNLQTCRDWDFNFSNLNHYNWCFWIVGLALVLDIPDDQWQRLLTLIGGEGEDVLLDRIIASRQPDRKIGTALLHPKPYSRLLKAVNAPVEQQARLLLEFVESWYPELARKGKDALWWYDYGDPVKHPLEKGSYFGRWCIEAVAAVKAFGLDDSLCLGHENYPGDLLRPNGPTTHKPRPEARTGWLSRLLKR